MRLIEKNRTSQGYQELLKLIRIDGATGNISNNRATGDLTRDKVITSLLEEQGYLCAYCMQKINLQNATIEHIIGQNYIENGNELGKNYQRDYNNLLAVCKGKSCKNELHCDKSRANYQKTRPLFVNPLINKIMQNIKFTERGLIYYKNFTTLEEIEISREHNNLDEDSDIRYDIQKILNLNCQNLKERREALIKALKRITKNWTNKHKIESELSRYQNKNSNQHYELSQVAIYYLSKYL